uniref:Uncharacterized protein n=1 Tax=Arundo donax TaxID=35708 RepID=A0A0A9ETP9_ARUDO
MSCTTTTPARTPRRHWG